MERNEETHAQRIVDGDRAALARALSEVERGSARGVRLREVLSHAIGQAARIGITGPPGAGKSTLIEELALRYRAQGRRVAVVAVDPTSPLSGGALLGDRVRMSRLQGDPDVFVRSMASRGALGGLSASTRLAVDLFDAARFDPVLIETVGVGQTDVRVAQAAHVVVLVMVPEAGDVVQGLKAGLIELADVIVINKSDRSGADELATALRDAISMRAVGADTQVLQVSARQRSGFEPLMAEIASQLERARSAPGGHARALVGELRARLEEALYSELGREIDLEGALSEAARRVLAGDSTPACAVQRILDARRPRR